MKKIILVLVFWLAACAVPAPAATATRTFSPAPTGTATPISPTPTETSIPATATESVPTLAATAIKEYQVLAETPLILEGARLSEAQVLTKEQLPKARADILKMYEQGKILPYSPDVPILALKNWNGKDATGSPSPGGLRPIIDKSMRSIFKDADMRQMKVVGIFGDGGGGAWAANLWLNPDRTVSTYWYHLIPPFVDGQTLEGELQKLIDQTNSDGFPYGTPVVMPGLGETPALCAMLTANADYCETYLLQSPQRISAFQEWQETGFVPVSLQNGEIELMPRLDSHVPSR